MKLIYAIHKPDPAKLEPVKREMRQLGGPSIRCVDCGDYYQALEGSHRLAAAKELGLKPALVIYAEDDVLDITAYDWYEPENWAGTSYKAGDVASELFSYLQAVVYRFEDGE